MRKKEGESGREGEGERASLLLFYTHCRHESDKADYVPFRTENK